MGVLVFFLVPETKGRTLERMDEIFGTAYGDLVNVELRDYRRERGLIGGGGGEKQDAEKGTKESGVRNDGMEIVEVVGEHEARVEKEV